MTAFTVGQRVKVIEPVDGRYGQEAEILYIDPEQQNAILRFDDGTELGYLIDDDEIAPA